MPWKCPACSTSIRNQLTEAGEALPSPKHTYVCCICHLPLVLNDDATAMVVAPLPEPDDHAA